MRLDEDKVEALRRWGQGLQQAGREESFAAGRAILMLIAEIEYLHSELWHARQQLRRVPAVAREEAAEDIGEPFLSILRGRLQRVLRRESSSPFGSRPEPVEEAGARIESDRTSTSAQAWIEALRRQQ
jgi:hypothetical protein